MPALTKKQIKINQENISTANENIVDKHFLANDFLKNTNTGNTENKNPKELKFKHLKKEEKQEEGKNRKIIKKSQTPEKFLEKRNKELHKMLANQERLSKSFSANMEIASSEILNLKSLIENLELKNTELKLINQNLNKNLINEKLRLEKAIESRQDSLVVQNIYFDKIINSLENSINDKNSNLVILNEENLQLKKYLNDQSILMKNYIEDRDQELFSIKLEFAKHLNKKEEHIKVILNENSELKNENNSLSQEIILIKNQNKDIKKNSITKMINIAKNLSKEKEMWRNKILYMQQYIKDMKNVFDQEMRSEIQKNLNLAKQNNNLSQYISREQASHNNLKLIFNEQNFYLKNLQENLAKKDQEINSLKDQINQYHELEEFDYFLEEENNESESTNHNISPQSKQYGKMANVLNHVTKFRQHIIKDRSRVELMHKIKKLISNY